MHDSVTTFEAGYHGGITVATSRAFGQPLDVILVAPAQEPAGPVLVSTGRTAAGGAVPVGPPAPQQPLVLAYDADLMALPNGFRVLDPRTGLADTNLDGGAFVG